MPIGTILPENRDTQFYQLYSQYNHLLGGQSDIKKIEFHMQIQRKNSRQNVDKLNIEVELLLSSYLDRWFSPALTAALRIRKGMQNTGREMTPASYRGG